MNAGRAEPTATALLIVEEPWLYRALREGLQLETVERMPSGVEYDVGIVRSRDGTWRLAMPADAHSDGTMLARDLDPAVVVLLQAERTSSSDPILENRFELCVATGVHVSDARNMTTAPLPASIAAQVERLRLRGGSWDASTMLKISDAVAAPERFARVVWASASPRSPAIVAIAARHVLSLASSMFAPSEPSAKERASIAAFLRDLFVSLSVAPFASTKLAQPAPSPNAAPPNPRFVPVSGALTAFELRATRMFDRVAWQAPDACGAWHVILGDNASGKTSLLRAIALALLDRDEREAMRQDWSTWLRHDAPDGAVTVTLTDADSATHALSLELKRAARNGAGRHVDVRSSETLRYGGFLAAYGPFRRFTGGDPEWLKSFSAHPRTQRVVTLFEERAALSDALEWLKDLWVRAKTIKDAPEKSFLDRLLRFINGTGFLPPDVELLQPDADGVWCRDGAGRRVPVIDLSDGYRAALSLTLDLVRHLAMEHGHAKVFPRKAATAITLPGIVLIDEPDAHLHPTWQQRIGAWFKRTFPSMQFVVTTHSPIVCQAADSVLLLPAPGDDGPARMATPAELDRLRYGDVLDAFATEFFGRKVTRSEEGRKRLKQLAALNLKAVQQGLDDREREEQERLRGELGAAGEAPDAAS